MNNVTTDIEIYLIRHTTPDVEKGICYGQADLDVTESFLAESAIIKRHLPVNITQVYSSPLQRCKKLADHLFDGHKIQLQDELMEVNCGSWELKPWDEIPRDEIDAWVNQLTVQIPKGESYTQLYDRVKNIFLHIHQQTGPIAIVTHGGVIRSILTHLTGTNLKDSFKVFSLHYGCVIKITNTPSGLKHQILSNILHEKETHRPSYL